MRLREAWPWAALALLLGAGWLAYLPGLSGGFLFDDFVNLNAIGATGPVDDWPTFWRYITSGTADPTGRPLALLSFLVEARSWPAEPYPFLRDNVLLHLVNGALLYALLLRLGDGDGADGARRRAAALLGAGLWLLHPLLVSTTLYVVQREAMLPATFTLLGLLAYLHGRTRFVASAGASGQLWMLAGIGLGTLLATLSKGNGVLLPMLALVLEATVLGRVQPAGPALARLRRLQALLLLLPSLLVLAWLASYLPTLDQPSRVREWTTGERLLTEPRAIVAYLRLLLVPTSMSSGLFNESFVVSTSLLRPWTTLPAIALVLALLAGAIALRRQAPVVSAALLFFFAGHLLESTVLPLELYFEHRNYLPAMLLFWPLACLLVRWRRPAPVRAAAALALLLLFATTTWQRATLWGQPTRLAEMWAARQPGSSRAQAAAAIAQNSTGNSVLALKRLAAAWNANPNELQIGFNYIDARCRLDGPTDAEKRFLRAALRSSRKGELLTYRWLSAAIEIARRGQCRGLRLDDVEQWVEAAKANPGARDARVRDQTLEPLLAQLALARGRPAVALSHLRSALRAKVSPDAAARYAVMLAGEGHYREALVLLDDFDRSDWRPRTGPGMPWLHARVLEWQGYWPNEFALLRQRLRAEIDAEAARK